MVTLGLDLGTHMGWAVLSDDVRVDSGTWQLDQNLHEGGGWRFLLFRQHLLKLLSQYKIEAVGYELVRRHGTGNNTQAAHVWGGFKATLQALLDDPAVMIPYCGLDVGTVKKTLTGKGNAGKELMCQEANARWGLNLVASDKANETGDNEADALAVALALYQRLQSI